MTEKTNLFNRLLNSLPEDQGFVAPGSGGVIHLTPYLSLIVAILYMMAADDEISDQECNHLLSVFGGDQQILQRALNYVESKSVDEFLAEMPDVVEDDDRLCILLNVCDSSMSDGDLSKTEMILFSRMLSSLGYDKHTFKPYFDTISLKNKHSVLEVAAGTDTSTVGVTPLHALIVAMLYMTSVDGDIAKEEIGQINVALRGSKTGLPDALKYVKQTKFPDFMNQVITTLNQQQKICILINVADCMLSDQRVDRLEQDLFRRFLAGFDISDTNFKKYLNHLTIKNDRPVDIRKASKSGKNSQVIQNKINTDENRQFADAQAAAASDTAKPSAEFAPGSKIAREIADKIEKSTEAFEFQTKLSEDIDLVAANAKAREPDNKSPTDTRKSFVKKTTLEADNKTKKNKAQTAPDAATSQASDQPVISRHESRDDQGGSRNRQSSDGDGESESERRRLRDGEGDAEARRLRDGEGDSEIRSLRDGDGESEIRSLRDGNGNSEIRSLRDGEGNTARRNLNDGQGDIDRRNLKDGEGDTDRRSLKDGAGDANRRNLRDGEGDTDRRSLKDGEGDTDRRNLKDGQGGADTRHLGDADGDSDKRTLRNAQAATNKNHLRDGEGDSDLRQTSDADGDVDFRTAKDASAGAKSRHLQDNQSRGGKKLKDSAFDIDGNELQDDDGSHDPESHLHVRMDYLKTWTGSLKDNLDEFESIDARHTNKKASALEMVTIRPDRPAMLTLALAKSAIAINTQPRNNDNAISPWPGNFDMTEKNQAIASEPGIVTGVDKTRKVLAALTTGLIITQGFSSFGLSEAQNAFMTNQLLSSTTHMSVQTLTVQQGTFNLTADLMDHIVSKNESYSTDLRELSKTSAETYRTEAQKIESGTGGTPGKPALNDKIKFHDNQSAIQLMKLKWFGLANGILMLGFFMSFFGLFFKSRMSVTGSSIVFILGTLVTLNGFYLFI
ncbi:MAG: hypothetical protein LW731_08190 [Oxalobacteraceae bacterium]|nr:hypothetical protein [Oxalobacteraceae bacterium]